MKTEGIVLSRRGSFNDDFFLTLFTEKYGRMNVVAKRSKSYKSPLNASTRVFVCSDFVLKPASVPIVTSADIVRSNLSLMEDFDALSTASYVAELVLKTTREDYAERGLYYALREVYALLDAKTVRPRLIQAYFLVRLCSVLGILSVAPDVLSDTEEELRVLVGHRKLSPYDISKLVRFFAYLSRCDLGRTRVDEKLFLQAIDTCEVLLREYLDIGEIKSREFL